MSATNKVEISSFPPEVVLRICAQSPRAAMVAAGVCRVWRGLVHDQLVWAALCKERWKDKCPASVPHGNWREFWFARNQSFVGWLAKIPEGQHVSLRPVGRDSSCYSKMKAAMAQLAGKHEHLKFLTLFQGTFFGITEGGTGPCAEVFESGLFPSTLQKVAALPSSDQVMAVSEHSRGLVICTKRHLYWFDACAYRFVRMGCIEHFTDLVFMYVSESHVALRLTALSVELAIYSIETERDVDQTPRYLCGPMDNPSLSPVVGELLELSAICFQSPSLLLVLPSSRSCLIQCDLIQGRARQLEEIVNNPARPLTSIGCSSEGFDEIAFPHVYRFRYGSPSYGLDFSPLGVGKMGMTPLYLPGHLVVSPQRAEDQLVSNVYIVDLENGKVRCSIRLHHEYLSSLYLTLRELFRHAVPPITDLGDSVIRVGNKFYDAIFGAEDRPSLTGRTPLPEMENVLDAAIKASAPPSFR